MHVSKTSGEGRLGICKMGAATERFGPPNCYSQTHSPNDWIVVNTRCCLILHMSACWR